MTEYRTQPVEELNVDNAREIVQRAWSRIVRHDPWAVDYIQKIDTTFREGLERGLENVEAQFDKQESSDRLGAILAIRGEYKRRGFGVTLEQNHSGCLELTVDFPDVTMSPPKGLSEPSVPPLNFQAPDRRTLSSGEAS